MTCLLGVCAYEYSGVGAEHTCLLSPVSVMIVIFHIVNPETLQGWLSAKTHSQHLLMEWLWLVVSVSVLCSLDVGVLVLLSGPGGLILDLHVDLETRSNGLLSVILTHLRVELTLISWQLLHGIWLRSYTRLEICLSESGGPLLVNAWMCLKHCFLAVSSEEGWSRLIKRFSVSHHTVKRNTYRLVL